MKIKGNKVSNLYKLSTQQRQPLHQQNQNSELRLSNLKLTRYPVKSRELQAVNNIALQFRGQDQRNQSQTQNNQFQQKDQQMKISKIERKQQSLILYWLIMLMTFFFSLIHTFYFIQDITLQYNIAFYTVYLTVFTLNTVINIINSCITLKKNCKLLISFYFMADGILLAAIFNIIIQIVVVFVQYQAVEISFLFWLDIAYTALVSFSIIAIAGNFRLMMVACKWKKWQAIVYKSILIFCALFYAANGFNLMISGLAHLEQADKVEGEEVDTSVVVQFYVVQVLAYFSFYFELIGRMSDFDGTSEIKSTYILQSQKEKEHQEILKFKSELQMLQEDIYSVKKAVK